MGSNGCGTCCVAEIELKWRNEGKRLLRHWRKGAKVTKTKK